MVACHLQVKSLVELFLAKGADTEIEGGADINSKNEDNASAIALAANKENAKIVEYLLANGAE